MTLCALLCAALCVSGGDSVPPVLEFPDPGLDDPAAYQGYETRVFRDARGNALQVYLNHRIGRVVHVWADALDESIAFSVRDSSQHPAAVAWVSHSAAVAVSGGVRSLAYRLALGQGPVTVGLFLLGSMRVERDFQYQRRDSLPLDAAAFPQAELLQLIAHLGRLEGVEQHRQLALLGVTSVDGLQARIEPVIRAREGKDRAPWSVRVDQVSFDGKTRLSLELAGDPRETVMSLAGRTITVRSRLGRPVELAVKITTDAPALTPLGRAEIFNDRFRRFADRVRADTAHAVRFRRLEREVRGVELLTYREKVMAGLPNFATYFGRDMLMTALLMQAVWAPAIPEHVIASALEKLTPDGDVSHEEVLGGQAIRENAARYNRLVDDADGRRAAGDSVGGASLLAEARGVLGTLSAVRENYIMVDDDFQLPVVAAHYLADARIGPDAKRRFLASRHRLSRLLANLAYVARQAGPYASSGEAVDLVGFPRASDGGWISASWRDSHAGYGGGRFAMDVNVIWVPHALQAIGTILDALQRLGFGPAALDSLVPPAARGGPLATYVHDRTALARAVERWRGAERHFQVALGASELRERVAARLSALPRVEQEFWSAAWAGTRPPADSFRFLALALDSTGRPIPIVNTDPAMLLLLDSLGLGRIEALVRPILDPYPMGLFVDDLGPLVANDVYAPPAVWEAFRRDRYHSPSVVWGRDVNVLLAGLAAQRLAGVDSSFLDRAIERTNHAVERSGLRHAELWSYDIDNGRLLPERYGESSDVQLWSLTDISVQFLLGSLPHS